MNKLIKTIGYSVFVGVLGALASIFTGESIVLCVVCAMICVIFGRVIF